MNDDFRYLSGFGNEFASEAISGALPEGQNSPQQPPFGLYTEQLSGTAFTAPRERNGRTWMYRIRPSAVHGEFTPYRQPNLKTAPLPRSAAGPNQLRWEPRPLPTESIDFFDSLLTMVTNGDVHGQVGMATHLYGFNENRPDRYYYNADGEFIFVPQLGGIEIRTELGRLHVSPHELAVVPRGLKFQVRTQSDSTTPASGCRGYLGENYGNRLQLPELGPIGANGLANPRDFLAPNAWYEDREADCELLAKYQGELFSAELEHAPLDVVAWHGNYVPYKYDLRHFNAVNTVTFDHSDPSIFTVLTAPSETAGTANCDVVLFPPRWSVAEHSFRPPWFHRNLMSEFLMLIDGTYDGKAEGFLPGGASLHNSFSPHGPDAPVFERASTAPLVPERLDGMLAMMFESRYVFTPTPAALEAQFRQRDYLKVWQGLGRRFQPPTSS